MRTLHTDKIIEAVKEMCISANLYLADDMDGKIRQAAKEEDSTLGKQILNQLIENMEIAGVLSPVFSRCNGSFTTDFRRYPSVYPLLTPSLMASVRFIPSMCRFCPTFTKNTAIPVS